MVKSAIHTGCFKKVAAAVNHVKNVKMQISISESELRMLEMTRVRVRFQSLRQQSTAMDDTTLSESADEADSQSTSDW